MWYLVITTTVLSVYILQVFVLSFFFRVNNIFRWLGYFQDKYKEHIGRSPQFFYSKVLIQILIKYMNNVPYKVLLIGILKYEERIPDLTIQTN